MAKRGTKRRSRKRRKPRRTEIAAPPGTLVQDPDAAPPAITGLCYGPDGFEEVPASLPKLQKLLGKRTVLWVDVVGLGDIETIHTIGEYFGLHQLALEDVLNVDQRPKVEDYDEHLFIVTRAVTRDTHLESEQISIFVGDGFVLTLQERPGDCFEPVRERIRHARGRVRTRGADYLAYALLDSVVDHMEPIVDHYGDEVQDLEEHVLSGNAPHAIAALLDVRRDLQFLQRILAATRTKLTRLLKPERPVVTNDTRTYLRDCQDHATRLAEAVVGWRELASNLMDVHLALSNQQLSEVMKVLTIISTIFIPLGFIAGIYGMNFDTERSPLNMPELGWYFGYPFVLTLMVCMVVAQLVFFWRRGWLRRGPSPK